ncbi:MAG: hypothetical protein J6Q59_04515 [Paludibacteraceae bacterium]|nr:hypothetical protein [Paludibacteraceae bacterium]
MMKADVARLVALVKAAYPNYDKFKDPEEVKATVNLWALMFADDDARIVGLAVQKHMATNKWPPSVAELREIMLEIQHPELVPPDTAWLAVSDLLYSVGQFNHGDLYEQFPALIARALESIGWGALWDLHRSSLAGGKPGMDRLIFVQQYTPMYEREKLRAMTPEAVTAKIDAVAASIPDNGRKKLEAREAGRRNQEAIYRAVNESALKQLEYITERPQLPTGEDS